eukprot:TRINITY_DN29484_c0_g1_i2.p1 TRINITY_DN29484_c0_g1~~TRINITY_DN29484_c0_g1_i2.p1  ORF type:complete len:880 (+),score=135.82 TRINITY_DN29484_c0_g1_i2:355-2640(+)
MSLSVLANTLQPSGIYGHIMERYKKLKHFLDHHPDSFVVSGEGTVWEVARKRTQVRRPPVKQASHNGSDTALIHKVKSKLLQSPFPLYHNTIPPYLGYNLTAEVKAAYGKLKSFFLQYPAHFQLEDKNTTYTVKVIGIVTEDQPKAPSPPQGLVQEAQPEPETTGTEWLFTHKSVAVLFEGDLRRNGFISRVLVRAPGEDAVHVFDLLEEGEECWEESHLKALLESTDVAKIVHDCSAAADTLLWVHGVELQKVVDTQALWRVISPGTETVNNLDDLLQATLGYSVTSAPVGEEASGSAFEEWVATYFDEASVTCPWRERPLPEHLDKQSRTQVTMLLTACGELRKKLPPEAYRELRGDTEAMLEKFRRRSFEGVNSLEVNEKAEYTVLNARFQFSDETLKTEETSASFADVLSAGARATQGEIAQILRDLPGMSDSAAHPAASGIVELCLDVGRSPVMRSSWSPPEDTADVAEASPSRYCDYQLGETQVDGVLLKSISDYLGGFDASNRAVLKGSLHRASRMLNRSGEMVGLTLRFGRHLPGVSKPLEDLLQGSVLFIGGPGVGKTTLLRDCSAQYGENYRVVIVDASNEIAGDDSTPHPSVGKCRRLMVQDSQSGQMGAMIEAVKNHTPEVIVIDEISTSEEADAARTVSRRGVLLVATVHGSSLFDLVKNKTLSALTGGTQAVILSASEKRYDGKRKTVTERLGAPLFDTIVEIKTHNSWVVHTKPAQVARAGRLMLGANGCSLSACTLLLYRTQLVS